MILACHNLNKAFGEHTIVCDGSFHIEDREKAALVGINGAGKSTILKMIIGEQGTPGRWRCYSCQREDSRLSCTASGSDIRQYNL